MKEIILSLRKISLRLTIVIMFIASIVVGLFSLANGRSLGVTGIVMAITITLFYVTFTVYAIEDDKKAVRTSYIFISACIISMLGSFSAFNESPDFANMIVDDIFSGNNSLGSWANQTVSSSAPYTMLMNVLMLVGFFYSFRSVSKKFKATWWLGVMAQIFSACGTLVILMNENYSTFTVCNNISSVIAVILMITLLCIGGKNKVSNTITGKVAAHANKNNKDITSKSNELIKLKELLDSGVLTKEEFDNEKKKILNS